MKDITKAGNPTHQALFAATQEPTDRYNDRLKLQRKAVQDAEERYQVAKNAGDEDGMKAADHAREEAAAEIAVLTDFKSGLNRFVRTYNYIAQLIDLGDPDLENFAAFARLLSNRLDGVAPENVDLKGLILSGYEIKTAGGTTAPSDDPKEPILQPMGGGGSEGPSTPPKPLYLVEIIEKLNKLFGDAAPTKDQAQFVNHVLAITRENKVVMAQVEKADKDLALKGNLPGAVQSAVVRAMASNNALAALLMKNDRQAMSILTNLVYDLLKAGKGFELDDFGS